MNVRPPDVLVQLRLEARRHAVREHPLGQRLHVHSPPHRREQHRPAIELPLLDDLLRLLVILAVGDDELDLVVLAEVVEILPAVLRRFARWRVPLATI